MDRGIMSDFLKLVHKILLYINIIIMIRSKLHISSIMEWFKSRHRASTMENYLNLPEQIVFLYFIFIIKEYI